MSHFFYNHHSGGHTFVYIAQMEGLSKAIGHWFIGLANISTIDEEY
ncbi:hypothetical protein [Alkalihalobacterium bogoriense]|nr:hypothetical protein [Alkalihalobacterium bogoriense]